MKAVRYSALMIPAWCTGLLSLMVFLSPAARADYQARSLPSPPPVFRSLQADYGARCDGTTDDYPAVQRAVTAASRSYDGTTYGFGLDGGNATCAIGNNLLIKSHVWLRNVTVKRLIDHDAPPTAAAPLRTDGQRLTEDIVLENVRIDRNGLPTEGNKSWRGILLSNVKDVNLTSVEVWGDGAGFGILLVGGENVAFDDVYVHDMRYSTIRDVGNAEAVHGTTIISCTNCSVTNSRFERFLYRVEDGNYVQMRTPGCVTPGSTPGLCIPPGIYLPYQTDCFNVTGSNVVIVSKSRFAQCSEGSDTGHASSRNFGVWYVDCEYLDIGSFGQKWAHWNERSGSYGNTVTNAGLGGFVVASERPGRTQVNSEIAIVNGSVFNTGAFYDYGRVNPGVLGRVQLWSPNVLAAFAAIDNGGPALRKVVWVNPVASDNQDRPTMKFGYRREDEHFDVTIVGPVTENATIRPYIKFRDGPSGAPSGPTTGGILTAAPARDNPNAVVLVNGPNQDIETDSLVALIDGPTAAFSVTGLSGGAHGRVVFLQNTTGQVMTITDDSSSAPGNRVRTPFGRPLICGPSSRSNVMMIYDGALKAWDAIAHRCDR